MCPICQEAGYLRCECESQQPYCDTCPEETTCTGVMDAECVIYHFGNPDKPSQLINLNLPNGTSVEKILEEIDKLIGTNFNISFLPVNTNSISWQAGGAAGHKPKANVKLSADAGQILEEKTDGLFASVTDDGKVKVDVDDEADYLETQIVGSYNSSGGYGIDVVKLDGQLVIRPTIDYDVLGGIVCDICTGINASGGPGCNDVEIFGTFELGTASQGLLKIPITITGAGQITVTASLANESFFGAVTQLVTEETEFIYIPLFYTGTGSDGTQTLTIDFDGFTNTTSCEVEVTVTVDEEAPCVPVTIAGSPELPDVTAGVAYNYTIGLNGTAPFNLTDIIKPSWMSIAIVGGDIVFGGTPTGADAGENLPVSFTVHNCSDAEEVDFEDDLSVNTVDVINLSSATTISVSGITGFTFGSPLVGSGEKHGIHDAFTGSISLTVSATFGGGVSGSMSLYKNGVLVSCSFVGFPGSYGFPSTAFLSTDVSQVRWSPGPC